MNALAAGLAGSQAGDNSADAIEGVQAGKMTVENNALSLAACYSLIHA